MGSKADIDLAVVFVEGLFDCSILKLSNESVEINQEFTINGFKPHKKGSYKLERLNGSIKKISQIYSNSKTIDTYELNIGDGDSIERGYSGSAIVYNGFVVAVATDRNSNGKQAYAVPIGYLGEIWSEIDEKLFISHKFLKLKKFNIINKFQKYLLQTVAGVIILGVLTNFVYDILKPPSNETSKVATIIKENNSINSTIELHNEKSSSVSEKEIEFTKNRTKNSTIKVFQ